MKREELEFTRQRLEELYYLGSNLGRGRLTIKETIEKWFLKWRERGEEKRLKAYREMCERREEQRREFWGMK
jgi:hypothetical protein